METANQGESALTLLEIMVAMGIMVLLLSISWAGFFGLRTTMRLHKASGNLESDLRYAQRASMFVKREKDEYWIKGIGVRFNEMGTNPMTYSLFKWCSSSLVYSDFMPDEFPYSVDAGEPIATNCLTGGDEGICPLSGKDDVLVSKAGMEYVNTIPELSGTTVEYIVFEGVTGVPHFYDSEGLYINESLPCYPDTYDINMTFNIGDSEVGVVINNFGDIYKNVPD